MTKLPLRKLLVSVGVCLFAVIAAVLLHAFPAEAEEGSNSGNVNPYYGSFSTEVPIAVPAYHGLEPKLKLVYNSTGRNGFAGVGWGLSGISYIERGVPGGGSPRYDGNDAFFLDGMELIPSTLQGGTHCTKIQNYTRIEQDTVNNRWYVTGTNGNLATYEPLFVTAKGTFRWFLTSVADLHGNVVNYNYWNDSNLSVYLDTITYNSTTITFYRESRPDVISFGTGAGLGRVQYRLKSVDVQTDGNRVRAFGLTYNLSASTSRSLLANVQQFGKDALIDASGSMTAGTALPGMTLETSSPAKGLTRDRSFEALPFPAFISINGQDGGVRFVDLNGDGKQDIVRYTWTDNGWYGNGGQSYAALNTGSGWVNAPEYATLPFPAFISINGQDGGVRFVDLNGDGKQDIVRYTWTDNGWYGNGGQNYVALNTGSGWVNAPEYATLPFHGWISINGQDGGVRFVDLNGDGKQDIVRYTWTDNGWYGNGSQQYACLNTGGGWISAPEYTITNPYTLAYFSINGQDGGARFADLDGDGKQDLVRYTWTDNGWYGNGSQYFSFMLSNISENLTTIQNGIGGTTNIDYTPSSAWDNTYMPEGLILHTVSSITTDDGRGNSSTVNYSYEGGLWSSSERRFLGFRKVTAVLDAQGNYTETYYLQHKSSMSQPELVYYKDVNGNNYRFSEYQYDYNDIPPYTSLLVNRLENECNLSSDCFTTLTQLDYDNYGNLTTTYEYGEVLQDVNGDLIVDTDGFPVTTGDERTTNRTYAYNTNSYVVSLPATKTVHQGISIAAADKLTGTTYYYDGVTDCSAPSANQIPTKGDLTRTVNWLDGRTDPETWMGYDTHGNLTCTRDAKGNTSYITYDSTSTYPIKKTDPLGREVVTKYYGVDGEPLDNGLVGQIKTITDINGAGIESKYDALGRKEEEIFSDGSWKTWSFNSFGSAGLQSIRSNNSAGLWSEDYFDGAGRVYKNRKSGPDNKTIVNETVYDSKGRIARSSLPYFEGDSVIQWTIYAYDAFNRVTQMDMPDNTDQKACYGNKVTVNIDANGHRKRETRDAYNRLVKVEEYEGVYNTCTTDVGSPYATTQYDYDLLGRPRFVTDTKENQSETRYDTLGRKIYMDDPDMGVWIYEYDANGNLTYQKDAKNQEIRFYYDALNRITKKDYPTGIDVLYAYDEPGHGHSLGRLTTVTDGSGSTEYHYDDPLARITRTISTIDATSYTITTVVDELGRTKSITYPDNELLTYTYNSGGYMWQVGSYATFEGYNALGLPGKITYGNNVATDYEYFPGNGRLHYLTTSLLSQTLLNLEYAFYDNGNILGILNHLDTTRSQSFIYDDLNRLTQAESVAYGTLSYSYDEIGNMLTKEGVIFTPDPNRPHAIESSSDGKSYFYDDNGNMINDGERIIAYDTENRPVTITIAGEVTSFVYDGGGSRVKKIGPSGTTTYIGHLYESTVIGNTKYIFAADQRVAHKTTTETYYYHSDHLGSSSLITDSGGNIAEDIFYKPFGETFSDTGTVSVNHKFTGQELDAETGLYFYNSRYYNPTIARFISADTIVPAPFNPQSLNRYSYVLNNPLLYKDPSGHGWIKSFFRSITKPFREVARVARKVVREIGRAARKYGDTIITAAVAYTFGGPVGPAVAANITLAHTGEGRDLVEQVGEEVFDDMLGFSPKYAYMASSITLNAALTAAYTQAYHYMMDTPKIVRGAKVRKYEYEIDPDVQNFMDAQDGTLLGGDSIYDIYESGGEVYRLTYEGKVVGLIGRQGAFGSGSFGLNIGFTHTAVIAEGVGGLHHSMTGLFGSNLYFWGGTSMCHQMSNQAIARAGYSNFVTGLQGTGSFEYLTQAVYGPYGSAQPILVYQSAHRRD